MEDPVLSTSTVLAVVLGGLLLLWAQRLYSLYSCGASMPDASLPRGSLGWPLIGESLAFISDPTGFAVAHVKRFGKVFKSSLFLRRALLGTSPEFAKFVASNSKLVRAAFPKHVAALLGPKSFMLQDGPLHISVKNLVLKAIRPEALRTQVQVFETIILEHLASWERTGTVVALDATQKLTWDTGNWVLFGDRHCNSTPEGKKNFDYFKQIMRATASVPVNLPGTAYGQGMKARAALRAHFKNLMNQAKGQKTTEGIFLEALLAARGDPEGRQVLKQLDDDAIADTIFLLNFAAYDTTSSSILWMLKLLLHYPDVFCRIQVEQQDILKSKDSSVEGPRLTWEDTRNMVYTQKFFQEAQRYVSLVPMSVRETTQDVKFEGKSSHSDPANYPDPGFNPDRFDVIPKAFTYIPFSAGPHMCSGIVMAKLILLILIHHLSTTYTHESAGPDRGVEIVGVFQKPRGGFPITVRPRN